MSRHDPDRCDESSSTAPDRHREAAGLIWPERDSCSPRPDSSTTDPTPGSKNVQSARVPRSDHAHRDAPSHMHDARRHKQPQRPCLVPRAVRNPRSTQAKQHHDRWKPPASQTHQAHARPTSCSPCPHEVADESSGCSNNRCETVANSDEPRWATYRALPGRRCGWPSTRWGSSASPAP